MDTERKHKFVFLRFRKQEKPTFHCVFRRKETPKQLCADSIGIKRLQMSSLPSTLSPTIMPKVLLK